MRCSPFILGALVFIGSHTVAWAQEKTPAPPKKLPNGVYAVLRESLQEKDVLPLKDGEVLVAHNHRYLKKDAKEAPRFLVVRSAPDVDLALAVEPKAIKEGEE